MILTDRLPEPAQTLVIEASAGTGKTWTMSTLAARFIAENDISINNLAIVTFSSAAAAEVKTRTRQRLGQCAHALTLTEAPDPAGDPVLAHLWSGSQSLRDLRRQRLLRALDDFDAAAIMTTHGLCDRLLTWLGLLADHDPSDRLIPDLSDLGTQATADHYLRLGTSGQRPGFSYEQAEAWVRKALFAPTAEIAPAGTLAADFVHAVRTSVEQRKRQIGWYTFDDMLVRCRAALLDSTTGPLARDRLSQLYPVLLVDEFQDTDAVQWDVIRSGFVGASTVVLIGDPKQSIYGFRGADVRAYLAATGLGQMLSLTTNHRSSPEVIGAIGSLLDGAQLGDPRIAVNPVQAAEGAPRLAGQSALAGLRIRVPDNLTPVAVHEARSLIDADMIADLKQLLNHGPDYQAHPSEPARRLTPADVAIIVSTNERGKTVLDRLRLAGLPAVFTGTGSVLGTSAARDWLVLLRAVESTSPARLRAASLTSFIGWDLARLVHASTDDFAGLASLMRRLGALLTTHNPASVLQWLEDHTDIADRLGGDPVGERTWADLRHIAHLLAQPRPPLVGPADWLASRRLGADPNEMSRRLIVHDNAVRILTVHQAKGLQFPVVYLPQLADRFIPKTEPGQPTVFHADNGERIIDLGLDDARAGQVQASEDEAAESLRACYVALTRATVMTTTWWVPTHQNTHASPLHRLLFRDSPAPKLRIDLNGRDPRQLQIPGVSIQTISEPTTAPPAPAPTLVTAPSHQPTAPVSFDRQIDQTWRRTSFSSLTVSAHREAPDSDEPTVNITDANLPEGADTALDQICPMSDLPGGVVFGSLVHHVFEYADPAQDLTELVADSLTGAGMGEVDPGKLAAALTLGLNTGLGPVADNLSLADIPLKDRLAELSFELPLSHGDQGATLAAVAAVLSRHLPADDPLAAYPTRLAEIDHRQLRGFLTGSIDAVLRVNGRYIIVDYKTNRLGPIGEPLTLRNYTLPVMASAMMDSHYPLQALLYAVGLHRFLRWRLPGYIPGRHLGGIAYLFVRGMVGPDTPIRHETPCGVFPWRPDPSLIIELSDLLSGVVS